MHDFSMPTIAFVNMAALLVIILWAFDWRVAILASPACLACNTRGAMLGMVIGILIYCCVIWKHRVKKKVILGILILVGVIALSPAGRKMAKIDVHTMGTGPRSQWMMQAIQASKERPMLGYGLDTLSHVLKPASGAFGTGDLKNPTIADRTHNIFLDMLLQTGWIGLALFVTTVGMAVKCALNHPSVNNAISLSVLGGWIVTGLFNPTGITATLIMLMALFAIGRDEKE